MAIAAPVLPVPTMQFFEDATGKPLAGGQVFTYQAGTTSKQTTYSDSALTQANTNPVILDANGKAPIFLAAQTYKIDVQNVAGISQSGYPRDNIADFGQLFAAAATLNAVLIGGGGTLPLTAVAPPSDTAKFLRGDATPVFAIAFPQACQGRLTLTTALPVTIADVLAATTLYFSPYGGNRITLYTSALWQLYSFAELSIAVPATTVQMYDVFAYDSAGAVTLELLAWTNDTTRATALVLQDGVLCKSGALTRRYLGSFRTTGVSGQTEDSVLKRYVWNYYNRVPRRLRVVEATASWTYTLATWRQANGATANQVEVVIGVAESPVRLSLQGFATNAGAVQANIAFGENSVTVPSPNQVGGFTTTVATTTNAGPRADLALVPAIGWRYYAWLEYSSAVGTTTWWSTNTSLANGITGTIDG